MSDDSEQKDPRRRSSGRSRHRQRVKVRVRSKKKSPRSGRPLLQPALFVLSAIIVLAVIILVNRTTESNHSDENAPARLKGELPEIPPNKWVEIGVPYSITWHRQRHAGAAYDTYRKKYFVFGSDTHGENWDNSIHEFDPLILRWSEHYPPDRRRSYRVDEGGVPIAGDDGTHPWAMHVYGNLIYDPNQDALVVMSAPMHNPAARAVGGIEKHPTWIYQLRTREWRALDTPDGSMPFGFGGASAYDSHRDVIVTYSKEGLWELGPEREHWLDTSSDVHHETHHSMVYDSVRHNLLVFGGQEEDCSVWVYSPGPEGGEKGSWEKREPGGDPCAGDRHVPVAFDSHNRVALAIFDNPVSEEQKGSETSSTFVYDPEGNTYHKLPAADLPLVGMNYTMVYDPDNRMFYLMQGGRQSPPTVWALHLGIVEF